MYAPYASQPPMIKHDPRYDICIKSSKETIPAIMIVDSSQRNRDEYENPGHYVVRLPKTYNDVTSIELKQANIPNSSYSISTRNNKIRFTFDDDDDGNATGYTATIETGTYNASELASAVQEALNDVFPGRTDPDNQFAVTYSAVTQKLTITGPTLQTDNATAQTRNGFTLTAGQSNGADSVIGLGNSNAVAANGTPSTVTLPNIVVVRPDRYVVLSIQGMSRCDGNSNALMDCFCAIPMDSQSSTGDFILKNGDMIDNDTYVFYFPEPLPKLKKLEIKFLCSDGTVYDFNGRDHFMVFEITSKTRPPKM